MNELLHIGLTEFESTERFSTQKLIAAAGIGAELVQEYFKPLVAISGEWNSPKAQIRAEGRIGTLRVGQLRIDVRPRLSAPELVTLINFTLGADIASCQRSDISADNVGLDELLCRILVEELAHIRQAGLSRRYVGRRESLPVVRGRVDFLCSFPWNDDGMTSLSCRFHELTYDNLDNQLILAALERVGAWAVPAYTRQQVLEHRQLWASICRRRVVGVEDFRIARNQYTRLTEHYRIVHALCELIIDAERPASIYETSRTASGGLTLDMAALFEKFVCRLLGIATKHYGLTLRSQTSDHRAFVDAAGRCYSRVRPDFTVFRENVAVAVLDAKYKDYWRGDSAGRPVKKLSNEDLYQICFYAQRLQLRHSLKQPPAAYIIAYIPAVDEHRAFHIRSDFRTITWRSGAEASATLQLVFVPMTEILRQFRQPNAKRRILAATMAFTPWLQTLIPE